MEESYANEDDGYLSPDNVPVRAYANMLSSDDIWILATDKSGKDVVPDLPGIGRGERISISLPAIPAIAHDTFWEMEHAKLQDGRDEFADAVPSSQELEAQFVQWEKTRMNAYLANRKRNNKKEQNESNCTKQHSPQQSSSVFDDAYIDGKRQIIPTIPKEIPLSYAKAFAAEFVTAADIDRHEDRIYKDGRTPAAIRSSIKLSLRSVPPDQHLKEFDPLDIPPSNRDPVTHMVLHALLSERKNFPVRDPPSQDHNTTNRVMYQIFSDSSFPIHDNNFALYCKPHLLNLPAETAVELQTLRSQLDRDITPYRPIQRDALPEPTLPTFPKISTKQNNPPALKPRQKQWMRDTPPFLSDSEADHTYSAACAWMFGTDRPTANYDRRDLRHPRHPQHAEAVNVRARISRALEGQEFVTDFPRKYVPSLAQSPKSHKKMSAILATRDRVESSLEVFVFRHQPRWVIAGSQSGHRC
jgi:hypothetical protein